MLSLMKEFLQVLTSWFSLQNEDTSSIDTLDMALQRIYKTSKDLRHEVQYCCKKIKVLFCLRFKLQLNAI